MKTPSDTAKFSFDEKSSIAEDDKVTDGNTDDLHGAVERGDLLKVKRLIQSGARLDDLGPDERWTPLQFSAICGHLDILKFLIEKENVERGSDKETDLLLQASKYGQLEVVIFLLTERRVEVSRKNEHGMTALHFAAYSGFEKIVDYLIKNNADIEAKSTNGFTPLQKAALGTPSWQKEGPGVPQWMNAASGNHLSVAKLLVEAGCLVEEPNGLLRTPTLLAAKNGRLEVLKYLLSKNGNLFAREKFGQTALHLASVNSMIVDGKTMVRFLIDKGLDIEARDVEGWKPLHLAAKEGNIDPVKELVEKGANIKAKNNDGLTALEVAKKNGRKEVSDYLEGKTKCAI